MGKFAVLIECQQNKRGKDKRNSRSENVLVSEMRSLLLVWKESQKDDR